MASNTNRLHSSLPRCLCALAAVVLAVDVRAEEGPRGEDAQGIRRIDAGHLTLFTDLPAGESVDALGEVFDQAFGQWCAYFGVDAQAQAKWHVRGYLMKSRPRFEAAGLVSPDVPPFTTGYARADQLWLYDQTSEYYRRHLLLHEGTHAFMYSLVQGTGPPWFSEGMAELLATHRWEGGKLALNSFPRARDEVSKWGRIEIVQTGYAARRGKSLGAIFAYGDRAHLENEPYGWCWAVAAFLDGHPRYQARFRRLPAMAGKQDFNARVRQVFVDDWPRLNEDWQLFVANLDYGYDFARMNVDYDVPSRRLPADGAEAIVAADRGWQSSGLVLEAGKRYRLRASGRYQVAQQPKPWECEPGGVTIRYDRGQPLGILLAAVRADEAGPKEPSGLLKSTVVGLEATLEPDRSGTLYFRINESPGSLADNSGSLRVDVAGR